MGHIGTTVDTDSQRIIQSTNGKQDLPRFQTAGDSRHVVGCMVSMLDSVRKILRGPPLDVDLGEVNGCFLLPDIPGQGLADRTAQIYQRTVALLHLGNLWTCDADMVIEWKDIKSAVFTNN